MTIAGNLRTMSLGDLIQWLATTQKTGTLIIDGPEFTKKIYFRQTEIVAVASDNPREFLGHYLVGWGLCTQAELEALVKSQREQPTMLGELAVKQGLITEDDLRAVVTTKTRETLYDLVLWDRGEFRFIERDLPNRAFLEIPLPVTSFLFEGHRQRDERVLMQKLVPDTSAVPVLIALPEGLDEAGTQLLLQMDGRASIEEIALTNRCLKFDILKLVYSCVERGVMQIQPGDSDVGAPGPGATPWELEEPDIRSRLERGRYLEALRQVSEVLKHNEDNATAREWGDRILDAIATALDREGIDRSDILEPSFLVTDLVNLECEPAEGFVLSRVTGTYSYDEVLRQLPGAELNNRVIIHSLIRRGLVKSRAATSIRRFKKS